MRVQGRTVNLVYVRLSTRCRMIRGRYISRSHEQPASFAIKRHRCELPQTEAVLTSTELTQLPIQPSAMSAIRILMTILLVSITWAECAPFFDAIYDAINGNTRRSYGYSGYGNYGYGGYNRYNGYNGYYGYGHRSVERPRQGKTFKEICRVHYPDAAAVPGTGGIVCPY